MYQIISWLKQKIKWIKFHASHEIQSRSSFLDALDTQWLDMVLSLRVLCKYKYLLFMRVRVRVRDISQLKEIHVIFFPFYVRKPLLILHIGPSSVFGLELWVKLRTGAHYTFVTMILLKRFKEHDPSCSS